MHGAKICTLGLAFACKLHLKSGCLVEWVKHLLAVIPAAGALCAAGASNADGELPHPLQLQRRVIVRRLRLHRAVQQLHLNEAFITR